MGKEERENEERSIIDENDASPYFKRARFTRPPGDREAIDLTNPPQNRTTQLPGATAAQQAAQDEADRIRGYTAQITVTSTSQMLFPADTKRKFLFVQNNDGIGTVNMAFGTDATLTTGMKFSAGGGGVILDNHVPTSAIYMIGSIASNSNVTVIVA